MFLGVPLFLRTLFRLVLVCRHRHKGPPITLREPTPSNLPGCRSVDGRGTYITCLDCGQKFAYNHKTGRLVDFCVMDAPEIYQSTGLLVDFWGIHDAEA